MRLPCGACVHSHTHTCATTTTYHNDIHSAFTPTTRVGVWQDYTDPNDRTGWSTKDLNAQKHNDELCKVERRRRLEVDEADDARGAARAARADAAGSGADSGSETDGSESEDHSTGYLKNKEEVADVGDSDFRAGFRSMTKWNVQSFISYKPTRRGARILGRRSTAAARATTLRPNDYVYENGDTFAVYRGVEGDGGSDGNGDGGGPAAQGAPVVVGPVNGVEADDLSGGGGGDGDGDGSTGGDSSDEEAYNADLDDDVVDVIRRSQSTQPSSDSDDEPNTHTHASANANAGGEDQAVAGPASDGDSDGDDAAAAGAAAAAGGARPPKAKPVDSIEWVTWSPEPQLRKSVVDILNQVYFMYGAKISMR